MKLINIVCSGDFHAQIDLDLINSLNNPLFTYVRKKYHGGYFHISHGKATIYASGKYIIYGLKNIEDINPSFDELCEFLSPHIDVSEVTPPKIQNIVGMERFPQEIDLNKIVNSMQFEQCEYEPEQFPGLIIHLKDCTALIFKSGKVILPGGKSIEGLERCWNHLKGKILNVLSG